MQLKEFSEKIKKEATKENIKERLNPKTTGKFWAKIRNACYVVGTGLGTGAAMAEGKQRLILGIISGTLIAIGTRAHLDKSNK